MTKKLCSKAREACELALEQLATPEVLYNSAYELMVDANEETEGEVWVLVTVRRSLREEVAPGIELMAYRAPTVMLSFYKRELKKRSKKEIAPLLHEVLAPVAAIVLREDLYRKLGQDTLSLEAYHQGQALLPLTTTTKEARP